MTRKQKHLLTRILVAAVLFLAGSLLHLPEYVEMGVFLVCYAVVGWDIVWKAITNILHKAMGDHTRMRILWHLTQKEYCVSDLAKEIGVTESALSHQLRALRIVRLVRSRKEGKKVIYSLQDEHIGWVLEETYAHISER